MGGHPSLALACPAGSSVVWAIWVLSPLALLVILVGDGLQWCCTAWPHSREP